jgi:2-succinyl-6-hydroxy-2,4-cyclohexadiene-1-carboxylate synthase
MGRDMTSSRLVVDGLRWHVEHRGAGPTVLLLHGFTGRGTSWGRHATSLAGDFRVVAPDLPGHGRTDTPPDPCRASVERTADDLAAILAGRGWGSAHVVGYSLGARIALRLAVAHPASVQRLVLESPSAGLATEAERRERRAADEARATLLERGGMRPSVAAWEREPVFASHAAMPRARVARLHAQRLHNRPAGLAASLRGAGQGRMEPLFDALATIAAPTLVIAGALDPVGCPRAAAVATGIPGARLEVIAAAGHAPHLETPAAFRKLVLAFLKEDPAR